RLHPFRRSHRRHGRIPAGGGVEDHEFRRVRAGEPPARPLFGARRALTSGRRAWALDLSRDQDRLRPHDRDLAFTFNPMERLLRATINSWHGLLAAIRSEEAFRQELAVLIIAAPLAFVVAETPWKRLALISVILLLLVIELLNTAIEKLADRVS